MFRPVFTRTFSKTARRQKEYYEAEQPGLGMDFERKVYEAVMKVLAHPQFYTTTNTPGVRRVQLERFPHAVFYRVKGKRVYLLRCRADSQRPIY